MKNTELEKRALIISIVGALLMAGLGVYFAFATHSDAILLDGIFSGVGFFMASLTLKVASIINRPDDEHFHFGYSHFAPLLNVVKAMLLLTLCSIALASAILSLLDGGRSMAVGGAIAYGVLSTVGCFLIAAYIRNAARKTGSSLVALDAQTWIIDTLMSGAVLIAFVVGWLIQETPLGDYIDYLDPGLVTLLCLVSLPMPITALVNNLREVLLFAPDPQLTSKIEQRLLSVMPETPQSTYRIRLLKMGSTLNVLVHVCPGPGFELSNLQQLDDIRTRFQASLEDMEVSIAADLVFINDMKFAD